MKKHFYKFKSVFVGRPLLLLMAGLMGATASSGSALAAAPGGHAAMATAARKPAGILVDYCFTTANYAFKAETVGADVIFTFHPLGATAGGNLAIVYIREGATGAYPGYNMVKNAAGDFVFTKAIASGVVASVYFTYEVGAGGPQQNTAATPHSYTVGTNCAVASGNVAPTVSLTSPTAGSTFAAPASITLTAAAADADGTITKVEFFQGSTKVGEALTAPYTFAWANVAGDAYTLTAKATDNSNGTTTSDPVNILVQSSDGYCATVADYAYSAVTTGGNVEFTFHPLGATAGGNLAIIFIREGSIGAYPGYTMVKNAAGDFVFTKAIASGTVTSIYFTYAQGATGPEQTSLANPHTYTVGTSCRIGTVTATRPTALAGRLTVAPNPGPGRAEVVFTTLKSTAYEAVLYDLKGARLKTIGQGLATAHKAVTLPVNAEELASGIYLIKLTTDKTVVTERLVLSR